MKKLIKVTKWQREIQETTHTYGAQTEGFSYLRPCLHWESETQKHNELFVRDNGRVTGMKSDSEITLISKETILKKKHM